MKGRISRDTPLAEITLRRYEKPSQLEERDLVRKLCLSVGLLQPGDSRDVVVDILLVLLGHRNKKLLDCPEIEKLVIESRKKYKLPVLGVAPSNIRRQLKRLRDLFLVEKTANSYRINENAQLSEIFEEKILRYYLDSIVSRVKEYFEKVK
ncbi:hypothetical protein J4453_02880 [Candidatus Woesearchaeota archaeon]|nr:hypothetical protein [Candidatus Woesearchaeota archaeon]